MAQDYKRGQQLVADRDFDQNADFFQNVFEIGRRYKIMNPEKMRSEFGKLMYMLMDSADMTVQVGDEGIDKSCCLRDAGADAAFGCRIWLSGVVAHNHRRQVCQHCQSAPAHS